MKDTFTSDKDIREDSENTARLLNEYNWSNPPLTKADVNQATRARIRNRDSNRGWLIFWSIATGVFVLFRFSKKIKVKSQSM